MSKTSENKSYFFLALVRGLLVVELVGLGSVWKMSEPSKSLLLNNVSTQLSLDESDVGSESGDCGTPGERKVLSYVAVLVEVTVEWLQFMEMSLECR